MNLRRDRPILGITGFNLFTLLVFVTAPVKWQTDNLPLLCLFVLVCQLMIYAGFRLGHAVGRSRPASEKRITKSLRPTAGERLSMLSPPMKWMSL